MDIIWKLTPKSNDVNYTDLIIKIANQQDINLRDYHVGQIDSVVHSFQDEIADYILEHGLSALINSEFILEHIVPQGESQNKIVSTLHRYLDKVGIDNELIIVDPYFFAPTRDLTYPATVTLTIEKYLPQIDTLYIITLPNKVDATLKTIIENDLKAKKVSLNVIHKTSIDYHDRFWISNNRERGIITGTSLNGYGKKYSLLDRLNTSDVREIVSSLHAGGLI